MDAVYWLLLIMGGFLFGGVMFCERIPRRFANKDIYEISVDNNPGAFNVFKHCGKKIGGICLFLDVMKGTVPVLIASLLMDADNIAYTMTVIAPVFGHAVGLFNKLRGGKGIATSFGVMLGMIPVTWIGIVSLVVLYLLFSFVIKINPASKRSVVVYALNALVCGIVITVVGMPFAAVGCVGISAVVIVRFLCVKNGMVANTIGDREEQPSETN